MEKLKGVPGHRLECTVMHTPDKTERITFVQGLTSKGKQLQFLVLWELSGDVETNIVHIVVDRLRCVSGLPIVTAAPAV